MTTLTRADWEQRAQQLKIEGRAFINGEYTAAVFQRHVRVPEPG